MDNAIVSAMAGVSGSLVGASTLIATGWITQKTLNERELMRAEVGKRERLYGETLLSAYALLNRIRLSASDAVLAQAEQIVVWITEQYFSPNLSMEEMRALIHSLGNDPLKPFADACRDELKSIHSVVRK